MGHVVARLPFAPCSSSYSPRARSRRPRWSCSQPPTCRCSAARRWTTPPPSTIPASTASASCAPRRSRPTSPTACSTSASPAATGSRRRAPTWSAWASCATRRPPASRSRSCWRCPTTRPYRSGRGPSGGCAGLDRVHGLTRRYFESRGVDADIRLSYGATEAKVPDIVDCIVEITETGRALRAAGLRIIDEILVSYTELVANRAAYADPAKRHAMEQVHDAAAGCARGPGQGAGEAQRRRGAARRRDRRAARHEDADGERAVRRARATPSRPSCRRTRSTS